MICLLLLNNGDGVIVKSRAYMIYAFCAVQDSLNENAAL